MTDTTQEVSMSSTICANCVFADFDQNTQIGCSANRLELYKKHNIPIIMSQIENYNTFIVEDKICVYYRNQTWAEKQYNTTDKNKILSLVKNELNIPYQAILFFRENDSIEDIKNRLTELDNQKVKPKILTLVDQCSYQTGKFSQHLVDIIKEYSFDYWRIQTVQLANQIDNDIIDLVYDSTKDKKYMLYMTFECAYPIPPTVSQELHTAVHDDMKSFTVLLPNKDRVGKTVLKIAHKKYSGNSFAIPLEEKIKHYDDAPHLIKRVEEICPSLNQS